MQDQMPPNDMNSLPDHGPDREGAMAKADLYKLANYSLKLFKQMQDEDQLEGWVQAKITKAADYIASVYHYMEYEMKFSEYGHHLDNSDTLSEGQKQALKGKLMEAKEKMKELKKKQAAKGKKEKEVDENLVPVPNPSGADSAEKAKELGAKMPKPAGSGKDPISEETSSTGGTITREKGKVRHSHNPDRFTDEPHGEVASKVKAQSAADKAGEKAADKAEEKEGKNWEKRHGKGSVTRVKDGKKVSEGSKPDFNDVDDDNNEDESWTQAEKDKKKTPFKKVKEALKGGQKNLDVDGDKKIEKSDLAALRAKKVSEASKPSAGLTKKEKSNTVKDAKAGKDIGKPGKSFDKVAKAAGGGEKGTKIAAAAMWKNKAKAKMEGSIQGGVWVSSPDKGVAPPQDIDGGSAPAPKKAKSPFPSRNAGTPAAAKAAAKTAEPAKPLQSVMPSRNKAPEVVKESAELNRMKEFLTRLNG
jgi:hypothetical protein